MHSRHVYINIYAKVIQLETNVNVLTVLPLPKNPLRTVTGSLGFFLLRVFATICKIPQKMVFIDGRSFEGFWAPRRRNILTSIIFGE